MDSDVDAAAEQRLLDLLHEHAALTDLAERPRAIAVARSRDRDECDLDPPPAQRRRRLLGLGEGEPRAARPDANEHSSTSERVSRVHTTGRRGERAETPR